LPASAAKGRGASLLWAAAATKAHSRRTGVELVAIHRPPQSTVLFLNSSRLQVGDCHRKPTIVTVWDANRNTIQGAIAVIADVTYHQ